jgi:8-oxo-dGTP pyrophosphatase MutT (NUDIX family)
MDLSFRTEEGRLNCRSAAIIIREGRLLVMRDERSEAYYVPGGRIHMGEDSRSALMRELREELSIRAEIGQLLWIHENFFFETGYREAFHEFGFYYLIEDFSGLGENLYFERTEPNDGLLRFRWLAINSLDEIEINPPFLRSGVKDLPKSPQHLISCE